VTNVFKIASIKDKINISFNKKSHPILVQKVL